MCARLIKFRLKVTEQALLLYRKIVNLGRRLAERLALYGKLFWNLVLRSPKCKLCNGRTKPRLGYGRIFFQCITCEFIFTTDYDLRTQRKGMGMSGSWSGPGGGGFREYYLVKMLLKDLGLKSFLLYGTGNTETFGVLRAEGLDVVGCDISRDVVEYKKSTFGEDSFFTPDSLPVNKTFDGIVSVEVFEHFDEPKYEFSMLMKMLRPNGVICGTTNFHPGGNAPIQDENIPGYMSHRNHVAYWSLSSMNCIARNYGYAVAAFEMIRPGSVLPDEKYGQLWPNKRVFFVYDPSMRQKYFDDLSHRFRILPIDKP